MKSLIEYLNCGNLSRYQDLIDFKVVKFSDVIEKIVPFFEQYKINGVKNKDFKDFCKVAELMQNKDHLTTLGLEEIWKIKAGINRGRTI